MQSADNRSSKLLIPVTVKNSVKFYICEPVITVEFTAHQFYSSSFSLSLVSVSGHTTLETPSNQ